MSSLLGVVLFILALTLAIFFHEGGHFLTAKWFGMRVERFFLGFGPTIWSFRRGETEYGLKAIPAGGFCKISGMSPYEHDHNLLESERRKPGEEPIEPAPPERQFRNKPAWQRAIVLAAGSFTHFMIALLLIYLLLVAIGQPIGPTTNEIEQVVARGEGGVAAPAGPAGLRAGDRIVEVDRKPVTNFTDLQNALKGTAGRAVPIVYERDGQRVRTTITPATIRAANGETRAFLGVQPTRDVVRMNPIAAVPESGKLLWRVGAASVGGLGSIFTGLADRFQPAEPVPAGGGGTATDSGSPVGIIGIGRLAGQAVAADQWIFFILLLIQFNVFVGIVNLLPIPPMDGGYLGFLAWEKVTGRTVDLRRVAPVAFTIVVLLVFLTVGLVYLDITNPISNPFR